MNVPPHQVPVRTLTALGTGGGGTSAVRALAAAQYSKHLLLVWAVRTTARCDRPRCADAWWEDARREGGRCDGAQPASGLLQRAYGCLGVSGFWRWQRLAEDRATADRARLEYTRWREAAATATTVLQASGRLTDAGRAFAAGMAVTLQASAALSRPRAGGTTVLAQDAGLDSGSVDGVLADDVIQGKVPDVTGVPLRDLDGFGPCRLADAARRLARPGRDGR